jgi:IS30 family transposase
LELGRAPSTISREIKRNKSQRGYRAHSAEYRAQMRARRPKPCLLESDERLREVVVEKLQRNWSPRQISGYLIECQRRSKIAHLWRLKIAHFMPRQRHPCAVDVEARRVLIRRRGFARGRSARASGSCCRGC